MKDRQPIIEQELRRLQPLHPSPACRARIAEALDAGASAATAPAANAAPAKRSLRLLYWAVPAAAAAGLALLVALSPGSRTLPPRPAASRNTAAPREPAGPPQDYSPQTAPAAATVQITDTVVLGCRSLPVILHATDGHPLQPVRIYLLKKTQWTDPVLHAQITLAEPRSEIVYVRQTVF